MGKHEEVGDTGGALVTGNDLLELLIKEGLVPSGTVRVIVEARHDGALTLIASDPRAPTRPSPKYHVTINSPMLVIDEPEPKQQIPLGLTCSRCNDPATSLYQASVTSTGTSFTMSTTPVPYCDEHRPTGFKAMRMD